MGCDIHPHFEVKIDGEWHYYGQGNFDRNYLMFAKLAGVRDYREEIDKVDEPRGLPEDATYMTKFHSDEYGADGHSHSYVSSTEYVAVIKYLRDEVESGRYVHDFDKVCLFGNSFCNIDEKDWFPDLLEDFRMVFWFDN